MLTMARSADPQTTAFADAYEDAALAADDLANEVHRLRAEMLALQKALRAVLEVEA